ncbi:MAG: glutamate 5-kinase [Candidatus Ratteibacteria bacterium]|nr:glutamate 5-kinase [Candidatus Ratteibacteria bacterium]
MKREKIFKGVKRVVIKIGTNVLTSANNRLDLSIIEHLVEQVCYLIKEKGIKVIIVTSGAIGAGMQILGWKKRPMEISKLQAAASVGQSRLMRVYDRLFREEGINVGQILLTRDAFTISERRKNARETINTLLALNVVPIINENDSVAVEEIKVGDNDILSAYVAELSSADMLIIITDVDGLSSGDPKQKSNSEVIHMVDNLPEVEKLVKNSSPSGYGTGGMKSKISAAKYVTDRGIYCVILNGKKMWSIKKAFKGGKIGTLFLPTQKKQHKR